MSFLTEVGATHLAHSVPHMVVILALLLLLCASVVDSGGHRQSTRVSSHAVLCHSVHGASPCTVASSAAVGESPSLAMESTKHSIVARALNKGLHMRNPGDALEPHTPDAPKLGNDSSHDMDEDHVRKQGDLEGIDGSDSHDKEEEDRRAKEEADRKAAEEEARKAEEEAQRVEEEAQKAEEEARKAEEEARKAEEERKAAEEEAKRAKEEEEARRAEEERKVAEEEARRAREEEERKAAEDAARRAREEDEARRIQEEEGKRRRAAEEEARRAQEEADAEKKAEHERRQNQDKESRISGDRQCREDPGCKDQDNSLGDIDGIPPIVDEGTSRSSKKTVIVGSATAGSVVLVGVLSTFMFVRRQKANRRTKAMRTYLNPTITADPSDRPGTFHGQSFRQGMLPPLINEYEYGGHDDLNGASNVHGSRMVPSPPSSQGRLLHKPSRSPGSSLSLNNIKWASSMPRAQQSVPDDMYPHYEPCSRPYAGHETFSPYIFLEPEATYNPHGWIEGYDYPHHDQDGPQQYVASYPQDHCYPMEPRHYLEEDKYSSFVTPVTTGPVMTSSATPTVPVSVSQTWQPRPPVFQDAQEPHRGPEDHGENGNGDV